MNIQITFKGTRALRGTDKRGEANLDNIYASKLTKEKIWPDFSEHFRSPTTAGSYVSDIQEIMDYFQKDFWLIREAEVEVYYRWLENKVKQGDLSPGTMAKKSGNYIRSRILPADERNNTGLGRSTGIIISPI